MVGCDLGRADVDHMIVGDDLGVRSQEVIVGLERRREPHAAEYGKIGIAFRIEYEVRQGYRDCRQSGASCCVRPSMGCSAEIVALVTREVKGHSVIPWKAGSDDCEVGGDDAGDLGVEGFDADEEGVKM